MIDAFGQIPSVQLVPMRGFIGIDRADERDVIADGGDRSVFALEYERDRLAVALAHDDHATAFAVLVHDAAPIAAMLFDVGGLHVAAEVGAIDLDFTGHLAAVSLGRD